MRTRAQGLVGAWKIARFFHLGATHRYRNGWFLRLCVSICGRACLDESRGHVTLCHMNSASYSLAKRAALYLLERGEAHPSEIAELAGVSRMTVYRWAAEAGIDWERALGTRLSVAWDRAERRAHGRRAGKKPTKARLRQIADEAKVGWDQLREHDDAPEPAQGAPGRAS